ncbi:MAG: hypothetical protein P4M11_10300 [Candidatus Pacebacteria bacterium]|nr:hypothetical protein [Candidatus Paceibacterota bacterium]
MANEMLADEGASIVFEYPKDDEKFRIAYQKGPRDTPAYTYTHMLDTVVYSYVAPPLDFKEENLILNATCSVGPALTRCRS